MSEQGCPSSCDNRATLQSVGIETHNSPCHTLSMKTFISHNQLQNKSLRQIMFFLHFCSPPLNTKCPWLRGKKGKIHPFFYIGLCLLCPKNFPRRYKDFVKHFVYKTCYFICLLFGLYCWNFLFKNFKRHLILWAHSYWIFGKACFWLLKDNLNSELHVMNHITCIFLYTTTKVPYVSNRWIGNESGNT